MSFTSKLNYARRSLSQRDGSWHSACTPAAFNLINFLMNSFPINYSDSSRVISRLWHDTGDTVPRKHRIAAEFVGRFTPRSNGDPVDGVHQIENRSQNFQVSRLQRRSESCLCKRHKHPKNASIVYDWVMIITWFEYLNSNTINVWSAALIGSPIFALISRISRLDQAPQTLSGASFTYYLIVGELISRLQLELRQRPAGLRWQITQTEFETKFQKLEIPILNFESSEALSVRQRIEFQFFFTNRVFAGQNFLYSCARQFQWSIDLLAWKSFAVLGQGAQ